MRRNILFTLIVALLLIAPVSAQTEPIEQDFFLSFVPNIQFSPFYIAIDKGYFEEAGYRFTMTYGDENIGVEQIASGSLSFGAISGEQVLLARNGQRPVVYVYNWFQQYPVGVVIPDTVGAANIPELAGKRVGVPGRFGASYSGLTALLVANDMTEMDIQLEAIGFNAPDIVCAGQVDAAAVYLNNEPLQIQARIDAGDCAGIQSITVVPVADFAAMVSNGIVTNEQMIAENPEAVRAVVAAFDRALRDVINNPAETYLLSLTYVENLPISDTFRAALETAAAERVELLATNPDRETIAEANAALLGSLAEQIEATELIQFEVLLESIKLWDGEQLGAVSAEAWQQTVEVLNLTGVPVDESVIDAAYTSEFIPEPVSSDGV